MQDIPTKPTAMASWRRSTKSELRPIRLPRRDEQEEILTSTTWTYAIVLSCGVAAQDCVNVFEGEHDVVEAGFVAFLYLFAPELSHEELAP